MVDKYLKIQTNLPPIITAGGQIAGTRNVSAGSTQAVSMNPMTITSGEYQPNEFADAVYSGGPYSLMRPNATTDMVAQNIDLIA